MQSSFKKLMLVACAGALVSCSTGKYARTNKIYRQQADSLAAVIRQAPPHSHYTTDQKSWAGTTNFNLRKPNYVIIHHTAQNSCEQTLRAFTTKTSQVSAHYVICRDGTIHHMLNDYLRAWHAGVARWGNNTDVNSSSIGIELDNNGTESFPEAQISSLLQVLGQLKKDYSIPAANFIGHSDIAPGRKVDPNKYFPWQQLSLQGYGLWYDTTGVEVPDQFDALQALRIIGYDTRKPEAVIGSFKLHYAPADSNTIILTEDDKKILLSLMRQSM